MKLEAHWTAWSAWKEYKDAHATSVHYRSRNRRLQIGSIDIATLVEADRPRYGARNRYRFFMYSANSGAVYGPTAFRTAREFIRQLYK